MKQLASLVRLGLATLGVGVILMMTSAPAHADNYPTVSQLTPFSADCNYMSQAGYLRFLVFDNQGIWLGRGDAVAIVNQQTAAGE